MVFVLFLSKSYSQSKNVWLSVQKSDDLIVAETAQRPFFPSEIKLFQLDYNSMKQSLVNVQDRFSSSKVGVIITLPNADGNLEQFEIFEASNFEPALQAQFPEIRSFVGKSLTDPYAILRMSADMNGISTMIFRTGKPDEFMEPYSQDGKIYAVYNSSRNKGGLPFTCTTEDVKLSKELTPNNSSLQNRSSNSELLTFRLALSCTGEYGAAAGSVALALARMNTTMTRVNGVFEKDLTIRMNIIANNTAIIFTNATTDPYSIASVGSASPGGTWNAELQSTLTSIIGEANYDIGHLFGQSGGGGNAGCIGCVCIDNIKGRGYTSPGSGQPVGDTFDIDYVAHEMGHQFGGNHTFSHAVEGTGVNVEPGSGSTIMGYAGITNFDVQNNSNAYFHYASIKQIETNMINKTCPVRTTIANRAPVIDAGLDYTIPKSTPFVLTGVGSDPDSNPLTYCWEQTDTATTETDSASAASATKTGGPNWRSYTPVSSPSRFFPPIARVIANATSTTATVTPNILTESLSSVARTLNFSFTGRDNIVGGGCTKTDKTLITVNGTAGPFLVTAPNTAVSWGVGTNQTVTWNVAGTTTNGVNAAFVDIYLSTNGGTTPFNILLASKVPNDGSETITVPSNASTTNRIVIRGWNHVFYDMSNTNFTITAPSSTMAVGPTGVVGDQNKGVCSGNNTSFAFQYTAYSGFAGTTTFTTNSLPAGVSATFSPASMTTSGTVTVNITTTAATQVGLSNIIVTATSGAVTKTVPLYLDVSNGTFPAMALTTPANNAVGITTDTTLTWANNSNATSYDVQVATDMAFTNVVRTATLTALNYNVTGLNEATDYYWRVLPKNTGCNGVYSSGNKFTTGQTVCTNYYPTGMPITIPTIVQSTSSDVSVSPGTNAVTKVTCSIDLNHTSINELTLILQNPFGNQVFLVANPCTAGVQNIIATFDDAAAAFSCGTNPGISGTVHPTSDLSNYNGDPSTGTWTLFVDDSVAGNGGVLNGWSINVCGFQVASLSVASNELKDFAIYPNPNNGNFNIQFKSDSNHDINIFVHDMQGRLILNKNFNNTGLFSESLQLNNAQKGVYLVTINDGDKKVSKRIVVE